MFVTVPICPLINLSDISLFAVIITLALTFNSNSLGRPPVSDFFQFCTSEMSEIKKFFGISSLAGIENNLFGIFFNMKLCAFGQGHTEQKSSLSLNRDFKTASQL